MPDIPLLMKDGCDVCLVENAMDAYCRALIIGVISPHDQFYTDALSFPLKSNGIDHVP